MNKFASKNYYILMFSIAGVLVSGVGLAWDPLSKASNVDSVVNTRHNLDMGYLTVNYMDSWRNDYDAVCVYCHTPHAAADSTVSVPLWNRALRTSGFPSYSFRNYTSSNVLISGQAASNPGPNSMTCLTCHDGTTPIDAVINAPGSGWYAPTPDWQTAEAWDDRNGDDGTVINNNHAHIGICTSCHKDGATGIAPSFETFNLDDSTFDFVIDLSNDHPIGIQMPADTARFDFKQPNAVDGNIWYFDNNPPNGKLGKGEIRLYDSGEGFEVECASCHDPHGVESAGAGSVFISTFLRVDNSASGVCYTCHAK